MNLSDDLEDIIDSGHEEKLRNSTQEETQSYPWPSERKRSEVTGELAERVCRAFDKAVGTPVFIIEIKNYGGYSEYTQENYFEHKLICGYSEKEFSEGAGRYSSLNQLLAWLDKEAPVA